MRRFIDPELLPAGTDQVRLAPMLANKFTEKKARFPCYVQPKLDGIRCLYSGDDCWTRTLKDHKPHILEMLSSIDIPEGIILDGELILPDPYSFQDTVSAVRGTNLTRPSEFYDEPDEILGKAPSHLLEYWVYDCIYTIEEFGETRLPSFAERDLMIRKWCIQGIKINRVPTHWIGHIEPLYTYHDWCVQHGYEGLIYRTPEGVYHHGRSGRDLLKLKTMIDQEYQIVDVLEATGKDKGTAIFVCCLPDDLSATFRVRPKGTQAQRAQMKKDRQKLIGKQLTVQYQELTDGGVPRFPIGISVRDYE